MRRFAARFLTLTLWATTTAAASLGQNLLPNGGFDRGLAPWIPSTLPASWTSLDAGGSPSSGSIRVVNNLPGPVGAAAAYSPCIPVSPGNYESAIDILLPTGQGSPGFARFSYRFYVNEPCGFGGTLVGGVSGPRLNTEDTTGGWTRLSQTFTVPAGAGFLQADFDMGRSDASGSLQAYFDNATVCRAGRCDEPVGDWITDAQYPDFRFRVRIGTPPVAGVKEASCLPEVVCVSGSLPGRSEVFLRIVGPRPNGFLWPTIVRFTPSRVEVDIEQLSTGQLRTYTLDAPAPGDLTDLSGLQDREGFQP